MDDGQYEIERLDDLVERTRARVDMQQAVVKKLAGQPSERGALALLDAFYGSLIALLEARRLVQRWPRP